MQNLFNKKLTVANLNFFIINRTSRSYVRNETKHAQYSLARLKNALGHHVNKTIQVYSLLIIKNSFTLCLIQSYKFVFFAVSNEAIASVQINLVTRISHET